jgi:release factor glutamine methyltransferase
VNVRSLLSQARSELTTLAEGDREAEVLLCHALGVSRSWLYANSGQSVEPGQCEKFLHLIRRRQQGEPIAYITGTREFWSLQLRVTPDVLIPRPETELLVETALERIPVAANWRIADLGTGSGAIALALASERPACEIHATDVSVEALAMARQNAKTHNLGRIRFHPGSWFAPLDGKFSCIVSNPPYVVSTDPHMSEGDCRFEPEMALTTGSDGMASIQHIATHAMPHLENNGFLAFEHGFDQGQVSRRLLFELGYQGIETIRDLAGLERVTLGTKI